MLSHTPQDRGLESDQIGQQLSAGPSNIKRFPRFSGSFWNGNNRLHARVFTSICLKRGGQRSSLSLSVYCSVTPYSPYTKESQTQWLFAFQKALSFSTNSFVYRRTNWELKWVIARCSNLTERHKLCHSMTLSSALGEGHDLQVKGPESARGGAGKLWCKLHSLFHWLHYAVVILFRMILMSSVPITAPCITKGRRDDLITLRCKGKWNQREMSWHAFNHLTFATDTSQLEWQSGWGALQAQWWLSLLLCWKQHIYLGFLN